MRSRRVLVLLSLWCLPLSLSAAAPVQITEFSAGGRQGVRDEDGDTPDWIELQNVSPAPVDLGGWVLSEESRRPKSWTLPATNLPPGEFVLVFASAKNRAVPGERLHTSFKLPSEDGTIVLRSPTGEVCRIEHYPMQVPDVSFGLAGAEPEDSGRTVLVEGSAGLRYLLPRDDRLGKKWILPEFDDSHWRQGKNGIGYDSRGDHYHHLLGSDLGAGLSGRCPGIYLRIPFTVTNSDAVGALTLHVQYDDGFVAWLNGFEVARRNAPARTQFNSLASANRPDAQASAPEDVPLAGARNRLASGTNWLAVHLLNATLQSSDLLWRGILDAPNPERTREVALPATYTYLTKPTPAQANGPAAWMGPRIGSVQRQPAGVAVADRPINVSARVTPLAGPVAEVRLFYRLMFDPPVGVAMADDGAHNDGAPGDGVYGTSIPAGVGRPGQMIRYWIVCKDEQERTSRWPLFADRPNYSASEGTVIANPSVTTRLPVLDLFTSRDAPVGRSRRGASVALFFGGELYDNVSLAVHGQISRGFPKQSYNLRFPCDHLLQYDTNRARVKKIELMSNFADKSKIRNTLAYEMIARSGCLGHFAFPVRVQKNGRFFSVAEVMENGDERWLKRIGLDPQGALYKMNNNLSSVHGAQKKTRKYEDSRDLASFIGALSEDRPLEARAAYAWRHINLPQCVSYFVAMALISSDDHGHKNYYLYRDSRGSGEWALLPWDIDLSWGRNWTGQYFNETIFVDNPLDLYRNGRNKPRNRLYNLFFEYPEFRQMYLRRLRTVMDELLQSPDTPRNALIIDNRVRAWMDALDPPGAARSDAALDDSAWSSFGRASSTRQEAQKIISEYLPGRRRFLFKSSRAKLFGDSIPASQPQDATLAFSGVATATDGQFVCLTNRNSFALDVSAWELAGGGIEFRFRPGTVVPAYGRIFVVPSVTAFRNKPPASAGQPPFFVQGNWKGHLQTEGFHLNLSNARGQPAASEAFKASNP